MGCTCSESPRKEAADQELSMGSYRPIPCHQPCMPAWHLRGPRSWWADESVWVKTL